MPAPQPFKRAILHIDGDSFFASCEVAMNPSLRGKPIVTGKERGIVSSMSYEARVRGITRAMKLTEVRKLCPDVVILPSDYETYSMFSRRMYEIVRRYTPDVEEYSIDECFADLTGLRGPLHMSYEEMAAAIKRDLETELGITFSVGLSSTKVLAKVGSKWKKPAGLTCIPSNAVRTFLKKLPVGYVWGIGRQTTEYLEKLGVRTALEYVDKSEEWVEKHMSKPYREIWHELQGISVYALNTVEKHDYQSISKTRTFTPPSSDRDFIFSQLSKNVEDACAKARRHGLSAEKVFFFLKTQEFEYKGFEFTLSDPLSVPSEIIKIIKEDFSEVYKAGVEYRATGVVLMNLTPHENEQLDLFGAHVELTRWRRVYAVVDSLDDKFGRHTVFLGTTLKTLAQAVKSVDIPARKTSLLSGENFRQRLGMPVLGEVA